MIASHELGSSAIFYRAHVGGVLGFFYRRTHDAELAAETFAAALAGRRRYHHFRVSCLR